MAGGGVGGCVPGGVGGEFGCQIVPVVADRDCVSHGDSVVRRWVRLNGIWREGRELAHNVVHMYTRHLFEWAMTRAGCLKDATHA